MREQMRICWPQNINPRWPNLDVFAWLIKMGIAAALLPMESAVLAQREGNVFLFSVLVGRTRLRVLVDTDRMLLNESPKQAEVYIKLHYRRINARRF